MENTPIKKKTSGLAIASAVLIIFVPILAVIFGIIAYIQISRNKDKLTGGDLAILGIIAGCLFLPIQAAILFPVFVKANVKAKQSSCMNNLKCIQLSFMQYAQDNDNKYPPVSNWNDAISNTEGGSKAVFHCPSVKTVQPDYAMNKNLDSIKDSSIVSPMNTICTFDSKPGENMSGEMELFPVPGRHSKGNNVAFADGHIKWIIDNFTANLEPEFNPSKIVR